MPKGQVCSFSSLGSKQYLSTISNVNGNKKDESFLKHFVKDLLNIVSGLVYFGIRVDWFCGL